MKTIATLAAAVVALAGTAQAADPAAGQRVFAQRCATCHMVVSPAGETIVKGGRTGPNQWGLIGRAAGSVPDFKQYGTHLVEAGKAGLVWNEAEIIAYLEDPREFLRKRTGNATAQSKMAFKLRDEAERANVAAYLATFK
jgi:cytochrome c